LDPYEEDLDIVLSDTSNPESDEDITIVSIWPAPGPSGLAMAIPHASDKSNKDITIVSVRLAPGPSSSAIAIPHAVVLLRFGSKAQTKFQRMVLAV